MQTAQLITAIKKGDRRAFGTLVSLWKDDGLRLSNSMLHDIELSKDVVQKAFIQVHHKLDQLHDADRFKSWFLRIVSNCCIDEMRKKRYTTPLDGQAMTIDSGEQSAHEDMEFSDASQLLRQALKELPKEQQLVVYMKNYEDLKFKEIAKTLNISENTAKSRLYSGLKNLKRIISNGTMYQELIEK